MTWLRPFMFGTALFIGLAGLMWAQKTRVQQLDTALTSSREAAGRHQATAAALTLQLRHHRAAQVQLRSQHHALQQALAHRQQLIEDLTHANNELRDWAAQPLPEHARWLRQRPALIGADAYRQWLSGRGAVPVASDSPPE